MRKKLIAALKVFKGRFQTTTAHECVCVLRWQFLLHIKCMLQMYLCRTQQ